MNKRQVNRRRVSEVQQKKAENGKRKTSKILVVFYAFLFLIPNQSKGNELTLIRPETEAPVREISEQETLAVQHPVVETPTAIDFLVESSRPLALPAPDSSLQEVEKASQNRELKPSDAVNISGDGWVKSEEGIWHRGTTDGHAKALKFNVDLERGGDFVLNISGRNRASFRGPFFKTFILDIYVDEIYVMSTLLKADSGRWEEALLPLRLPKGRHEIAIGVTRLSPLPEFAKAIFEYQGAVLTLQAYKMSEKQPSVQ